MPENALLSSRLNPTLAYEDGQYGLSPLVLGEIFEIKDTAQNANLVADSASVAVAGLVSSVEAAQASATAAMTAANNAFDTAMGAGMAAEAALGMLDVIAPTSFSWVANEATINVHDARNFAAELELTGPSILTLEAGMDGHSGEIVVKQDATGSRTLAFVIAERTIVNDADAPDTNPLATPGGITRYRYLFLTLVGVPSVLLSKHGYL